MRGGTSAAMSPPIIFDRNARRLRRDRLALGTPSPLEAPVADALLDRLDIVRRGFARALVVNTGAGLLAARLRMRGIEVVETDHGARYASRANGLHLDEDRLEIGDTRVDCVIIPGGLDTVDDLPGALIAARRCLVPDGLMLASLPGAPSLANLRRACAGADAENDIAVAHLHPQVDVRSAGDLLVRAGYVLPVADTETVTLAYRNANRLFDDLSDSGHRNVLRDRRPATRKWRDAVIRQLDALRDGEGRIVETATFVFMTGWSPVPH